MKIRIGNDFKTKWAITWLGEPEDFSDATDISLFFNIYDKKIELTKDVDYTITDNIIEIDCTPDICDILGVYNLELHYTKPNDDFIDGERRSAVDIDAFRIVGKSDKADATQDVSIISDAVAIFLDIAYKKLEEIEANEDVRIASEGERKDAEAIRVENEDIRINNEQQRQIDVSTAISNAEQATLNANNSAVYANEQGAYAEEMSSHPPTIIDDYWHIWNLSTNQYESTGQYARGDSAIDGALVVQEKGQSAVNTMSQKAITDELALKANQTDLVQLASDSITKYSEGMTLKDKQTTFDGDSYKIIQRSNDAYATRAIYNFGKSLILQDEPVSTNTFLNQRFLQAILSICLAGAWKVSDSDTYYIRRYYDSGVVEGGNRTFTIELGAIVSGANTLIASTGLFEYNPKGGLLRVPITGVGVPSIYGNIKGYMIVDQSMLLGLNLTSSISPSKSRISHISDLNYNIDDFKQSIFTEKLRTRFSNEVSYNRFVNRFLGLKVKGNYKGEPIYLSQFNRILDSNSTLTAISIDFSVIREGVRTVVMGRTSAPVSAGIINLPLVELNNSGFSGVITIDLRDHFFIRNINAVTNIEALLDYEIFNIYNDPTPIDPTPIQTNSDNNLALKNGFIIRESILNTERYTLLIDQDNVVWSKRWRISGTLQKSTDFESFTDVYTFQSNISSIHELNDGELLIFLDKADSLEKSGVWRSYNNKTEFVQVQQTSNIGTTLPSWGISIVQDEVIFSEYGSFTDNADTRGSRYLYYSNDSGKTFSPILDLMNAPSSIFPDPDGWKQCHLHGACIDPYWNRIWVCTGDGNNSKLLAWTDDLGVTWESLNLYNYTGGGMTNQTLQFISLHALPNAIVISPDVSYQYMFVINRGEKSDVPIIERRWAFNNTNAITHLTTGYKRFSASDPLYIMFGRGDNVIPPNVDDQHNFILATWDGNTFYKVWEDKNITTYPQIGVNLNKFHDRYVIDVENRGDANEHVLNRHFLTPPLWL